MKRRVPTIRFIRALAIATAALAPLAPELAIAQGKTGVVTVAVRPGVTMKYLEIKGDARPSATVILMAGGKGVLDLRPSGKSAPTSTSTS